MPVPAFADARLAAGDAWPAFADARLAAGDAWPAVAMARAGDAESPTPSRAARPAHDTDAARRWPAERERARVGRHSADHRVSSAGYGMLSRPGHQEGDRGAGRPEVSNWEPAVSRWPESGSVHDTLVDGMRAPRRPPWPPAPPADPGGARRPPFPPLSAEVDEL
jgi:hypothetical protein